MLSHAGLEPVATTDPRAEEVDIGLRREREYQPAGEKFLASTLRLARYAFTGTAVRSVNREFYRRARVSRACAE
jgi:hypothetical protein